MEWSNRDRRVYRAIENNKNKDMRNGKSGLTRDEINRRFHELSESDEDLLTKEGSYKDFCDVIDRHREAIIRNLKKKDMLKCKLSRLYPTNLLSACCKNLLNRQFCPYRGLLSCNFAVFCVII